MFYCADCDSKVYPCRSRNLSDEQEYLKCSTYALDKDACSAHFIRTVFLEQIVIAEINKLLSVVQDNEDAFVQLAIDNANSAQICELKKAKKTLNTTEKCINELDKLFIKLYEDYVSGKINDERFQMMSDIYDSEQKQLKVNVTELSAFIESYANVRKHTPNT